MKEILLCKYGEIVLKGANRKYFEDMLCKTLRFRAKHYGKFLITRSQSTIVIEPQDDAADLDGMFETAMKVFGIVGISRCAVCEKNMDAIRETVRSYVPQFLEGKKSFKVATKRSDKRFPLDSMEIGREIGGEILSVVPRIKVDVPVTTPKLRFTWKSASSVLISMRGSFPRRADCLWEQTAKPCFCSRAESILPWRAT